MTTAPCHSSSSTNNLHPLASPFPRYTCRSNSKMNDKAPLYWWISFNKPVQIFQIGFLETYTARPDLWATDKAASYEFYGSDTAACSKTGKTLIYGTRSEIVGKNFNNGVNGQAYHCYGLKVTKLADTRDTRK